MLTQTPEQARRLRSICRTTLVSATLMGSLHTLALAAPADGLKEAHISGFEAGAGRPSVDPSEVNFVADVAGVKMIGEVTALIPEASTADDPEENSIDGQSGDIDFPYATFKPIGTVGEIDPNTGFPLTGWPDGHAAWLVDEDTIRVAYQSESYAFNSNETYPWVMAMETGATFTGSHVHTVDYDRAMFAEFLENETAASEMFKASGKLFTSVYNVFGNLVQPKSIAQPGELWGKQQLADGSIALFNEPLYGADYYFHSFCGAFYEKANRYGPGIGFEDDAYLCAEEWNLRDGRYTNTAAIDTMGLASVVVDIASGVAYTVPALGQSGYEKLMPVNPGSPDYVVIVCAGYNYDQPNDSAPLRVYVGIKGFDADGKFVDQNGDAPERDKFLARNGLLYGKIYGMALANGDYATLNLPSPDLAQLRGGVKDGMQLLDTYLEDAGAPDSFSVRFYPTSYQWAGWGIGNAVSVADTEATRWFNDDEQPRNYTFLPADDKVEHPAVDPDITKFRYIQNMTNKGALISVEFTNLITELEVFEDTLPLYLSADVTRIVPAIDGALALEVGNKGVGHFDATDNTDGKTAVGHIERGNVQKMVAPDGLMWIKSADADVLIVDEDSGNDYGERKYAIVLDSETLMPAEAGKGYFLAMAGGSKSPRAANGVSAYGGTFSEATSSEFSGSWNVTGLVAKKSSGSFYSMAEIAGAGEQNIANSVDLVDQVFIGVVQHRSESGGPVSKFRADYGGQIFAFNMDLPTPGLEFAHIEGFEPGAGRPSVDPIDVDFMTDTIGLKTVGEVTALIPEASTADDPEENSIDGQSGDTDFPFATFKPIITVGEYDMNTGLPMTGWPDGHSAWLVDEDTIRIAYQSESYAFNSNETYPWVMEMATGATFTGSHVHTVDFDRALFAEFLKNDKAASEMFIRSGKLFSAVYNVFGNLVQPKFIAQPGELWGKQQLADGSIALFNEPLYGADYYFHSFCGSFYEPPSKYGEGIGFADAAYLCAEEWNLRDGRYANTLAIDTMGLGSVVVDIANETAYTVPALGQSGYEKLMPVNPGSPDYVVIVCAGYNFDQPNDSAPLRIYIGKKGVDVDGSPIAPDAPERDQFLARNGLLYGKIYGMALANGDYAALNLPMPDLAQLRGGVKDGMQLLDAYLEDATAPDSFSIRFYPTSYKWAGWGIDNAVSVADTEATKWFNDEEQPAGYTFLPADDKVEHPAVDPDITKFRYIQNMTNKGALISVEFTDLIAELEADSSIPAYVSAQVTRIVPAIDGALAVEVGGKGVGHFDATDNTDGKTAIGHIERGNVQKLVAPDGLMWIRSSDADVLIVDEDSGNDYGERKYAIALNPETLMPAEAGKGYFLAMAGGSKSPRAANGVSAYGGTFSEATSSEFSGSWNITGLLAKKQDGEFYTMAEIAGTGEQDIASTVPMRDQVFIGVVQHRSESGGAVSKFRADYGGQVFAFGMDFPTMGGTVVFDAGTRGTLVGDTEQAIRAGDVVNIPTVNPEPGWKFAGWDQSVDEVSGDLTVKAQYVKEDTMNAFDLYSADQLQALAGVPTIAADGEGNFVLKLDFKRTTDLTEGFQDMDNSSNDVSVNPEGDIEVEFSSPDDAAFYKVEML